LWILFAGTALAASFLWARPAAAFEFNHHRNDPRERVLRSPVAPSNSSTRPLPTGARVNGLPL